jgi:hypothetical protein
MQISQLLSWPQTNWPGASIATQYTVLQMYPGEPTEVTTVPANSALLSFDDSAPLVFQVRPSSGTSPSLTYGPETLTYVNQFVPCRAYIRQLVRNVLADRSDTADTTPVWPDDEINSYVYDSMVELNNLFPVDRDSEYPLVTRQRNYPLPDDFYLIRTAEYVSLEGRLRLYLKEKPWKGGESTATSYLGYPKLGILISPLAGRFYPGHFYIYEDQIWLDWDPYSSADDQLHLRYAGKRTLPVGDADVLELTQEDILLVSLRTQLFCWLRVESADARLSRWTTDKKRDDMPTVKMSADIQKLYNGAVIDRKERRPSVKRLMRR